MATQPTKAVRDEIRRDLTYMTARWGELGKPAIMEIRAFHENRQPQTARFSPDWIEEAIDWAESLNNLGYNIYAVRNPIRGDIAGSASDKDIIAAYFLWADCDDADAAGNVLRFDGPKWGAAVTTGTIPTKRVHVYWPLSEPCTDMAAWRDMQSTIAAHFASDPSVINPSRIMRIAGTVAYPFRKKQARGYITEITTLRTDYPDDRGPVTMDQMARVFGAATPARKASSSGIAIDTGEYQTLDRERATIQALSGEDWHYAVIRLVASYVGKGLSDGEIHALTDPLTLAGYTTDQTRAEVQTAIDGARRKGWTPEQQYADPNIIKAPDAAATQGEFDAPKRASDLEWFDTITASLTDTYVIKGVLSAGAMSVIYGPSNSGKTFFALDMAFAISTGSPWRGLRIKQAAVLYLAAEGGRGVLNRIAALKSEYGVLDVPLALKRAGLDLLHDQADLQHIADLAAEVQARKPEAGLLIVIDTLSRIMAGGDENSAADMTALIRNIDAIRDATGAHIMLVHHTGKDAARGARGHSSLRAAADTEIEVQNEDGNRAAQVTKQRDYVGGETFAFSLKNVELGIDQDGDVVSSCVVQIEDDEEFRIAKTQTKGLGGNQKILAESFDQMLAEGLGKPNPGGVGLPESGQFWTVRMDDFRAVSMGKMAATNKRGAFSEAWKALTENRGLLCAASDLVWRVDRKVSK